MPPFTKADILAMSPKVVDEYVLEQVLGYIRVSGLAVTGGPSTGECWVAIGPTLPWTRADQSGASQAPGYEVWPRVSMPSLDTQEWFRRIVAKAGASGMRLDTFLSAGVWSAAFVAVASGAPPATRVIEAATMEDATRRAALLAVQ